MYLDRRLWVFTAGVRGRIATGIFLGLLAATAGVARLALLGWLLGRLLSLNVGCRCQASDPDAQDQARRRLAHVMRAIAVWL